MMGTSQKGSVLAGGQVHLHAVHVLRQGDLAGQAARRLHIESEIEHILLKLFEWR